MSDIVEKVRSLGYLRHKGQKRTKTVLRDDNGKVAGTETEHWDDHRDAVATPDTARLTIKLTGEDG